MMRPGPKKLKRNPLRGGGVASWRWGICLTYRRWINFQMHKAGLDMNTPFAYEDGKQRWLLSAETIVSVLIDAGENDDRTAAVIHEGITRRLKRNEPMRRILEHLGAWLIETGYLAKDGKSHFRKIEMGKGIKQ